MCLIKQVKERGGAGKGGKKGDVKRIWSQPRVSNKDTEHFGRVGGGEWAE